MTTTISVKSGNRTEFIDITDEVRKAVLQSGVKEGLCVVYVPHTTAAVTINEGADPAVRDDITRFLNKLVPAHGDYRHSEGNSDAHVKATLVGPSVTILIDGGKPLLGTWQAVFFCEFDGPRSRKVHVKVV